MNKKVIIFDNAIIVIDLDDIINLEYFGDDGRLIINYKSGPKVEYNCTQEQIKKIIKELNQQEIKVDGNLRKGEGIIFPITNQIKVDSDSDVKETGLKFIHSLSNTNNE